MISKKTNGLGFRGLAQYLLRDGRGDIIAGVMAGRTPRELAQEFGQLRRLNPAMKKAVMHFSISPAPEDPQLTDEQWQHIAQRFVEALGYQEAPWVAVMHREDPAHVHMHIMTCRIDLQGRTVSNFNDYRKAEKLMRQLEAELGLRAVPGGHSPKGEPITNHNNQGDRMQPKSTPNQAAELGIDQQPFEPGTSNAALALALTHPEVRLQGASTDVPPKVDREMRRRNLAPDYETRMRQVLGDSLTRVYRHNDGVLLYFREKGEIQDLGSRLVVQGGMEEQLAAQRIVAMGVERGWSTINFTGNPAFIEHAMRAAIKARLKVIAKSDDQAEILAKVMAEQGGGMGSMAGMAPAAPLALPPGAVPIDEGIHSILSELDELPILPTLPARLAPVPPEFNPAPPAQPAPVVSAPALAPKPTVGVLPLHINFKERLQERRQNSGPKGQGGPNKAPAKPAGPTGP